jgi:hypothetical protein
MRNQKQNFLHAQNIFHTLLDALATSRFTLALITQAVGIEI